MHVCQSAERDRRNGARGSQKGRSARRWWPKMIIATNHEHTHTNRLRGAALAKVKLSFFVSLHLFQIAAKKSQLLYNFTTACQQQLLMRACVCSLASNKSGGVIKKLRGVTKDLISANSLIIICSNFRQCTCAVKLRRSSLPPLCRSLHASCDFKVQLLFALCLCAEGCTRVQFPFQPGQREKEASARGESE